MKKQIVLSAVIFSTMNNSVLAMEMIKQTPERWSTLAHTETPEEREEFKLQMIALNARIERDAKLKQYELSEYAYLSQCPTFTSLLKPNCYSLQYDYYKKHHEWAIARKKSENAHRTFTEYGDSISHGNDS
jgi:hypothetical protein